MAINKYVTGDIVTASGLNSLAADSFGWVKKTSTYTAVNRDQIMADTSGGSWTLTLPSGPANNDMVSIADGTGDFTENNLTIDGNGVNIHGDSTLIHDVSNFSFTLRYVSTFGEWRITTI